MKFTLLLPTKNEIDGMRVIAPRIKKEWIDQIVVIDGNSSDGTPDFARSMGYTVIEQKYLRSFGYYGEALPYCSGDVIITFSPDGNSIPELIPEVVSKMRQGLDMVIVSRYLGKAKSEDDSRLTAFGNFALTNMINLLFNASYTDTLVMFRAWRKELGLPLASLAEFESRSCIRAAIENWKVLDIPGDEPRRIGGVSKMRPLGNGLGILKVIASEFTSKQRKVEAHPAIR